MSHQTPTPTKDTTRIALVVGIALTALLLVGVGVVALVLALGGGDGEKDDDTSAGQTPEDAMRGFIQATNDADCEVLVLHPVTDLDSVEDCESELDDARDEADEGGYDFDSFTLEVDDLEVASETDTEATITIEATQTFELDGDPEEYSATYTYELEKDGDSWLVTDVETEGVDAPEPRSTDED
ncbi:hypothetical protein [Aeromicrobium sp. Sec7.5]|uniref:hypothetical protein n=1 Tax=Aeromicrobium sp. Sec7.5 TaxID=3121276 RepID=UPI002FE4E440